MYDIGSGISEVCRLTEKKARHGFDANKYGIVSRFINHRYSLQNVSVFYCSEWLLWTRAAKLYRFSGICSPNLVSHQGLVENMDNHRAHIGLYVSRDVSICVFLVGFR